MRAITLCLVLFVPALPAAGGETPWQEVAPDVRVRLISTGQVGADNIALVGVEIDMPPTHKTYWRVPGDTGLPTELDFEGSKGILAHEILWPFPTRDETPSYLDYVYYGPTVLPIELSVDGAAPSLKLSAVLGICSDICVPARAQFALNLWEVTPDRANALRLRQALSLTPLPWDKEPAPIGAVAYSSETQMLEVQVTQSEFDPLSIVAATASGEPMFGAPQKSPEPDLVLIPVIGKPPDLEGQPIQLIFQSNFGAFEVSRTVSKQAEPH
jgi:DsbC/DsbD-like thiol-disulfide interchange protein